MDDEGPDNNKAKTYGNIFERSVGKTLSNLTLQEKISRTATIAAVRSIADGCTLGDLVDAVADANGVSREWLRREVRNAIDEEYPW